MKIEFHQHGWIPGFVGFAPGATIPAPDSRAFCFVNIGALLASIQTGDTAREDLPYFLAESMMHEVIHVIEQWAGVEFSEERVEALLKRYAQHAQSQEQLA